MRRRVLGMANHCSHGLTAAVTADNFWPTQDWACPQSLVDGGRTYRVLSLPAELLTTDGFWKRDNHCLQLCIHRGAHPVQTLATQMILVKLCGSQKQNNQRNTNNNYKTKRIMNVEKGLVGWAREVGGRGGYRDP